MQNISFSYASCLGIMKAITKNKELFMAIKFIALDTDGTLLDSNGKILPSTKEAVKKALDQGIKVALCSGRPIAGLKHFMDELGIVGPDQYAITLNGAITITADGQVMTEDLVSNKFYRKMYDFGKKHHIPFNVVSPDSKIITGDHDVDLMIYTQAYENSATLYIRQPDELPADFEIAKGCFVGKEQLIDQWEEKISQEFEKDLYVVRADSCFLELLHPGVSKGNVLKELTEKLGIKPDEVMAIGDERNDLTMFEFAGTAVCMGNGSPVAKEHADYVTASNDEDGISTAFEKFL